MLFTNKHYLSRFSSYQSSSVKANDTELVFNSNWSYAYADYHFPEIVKKEIWATALIHCTGKGNHSRMGIGVKFANGQVERMSFDETVIYMPFVSGGKTNTNNVSFTSSLPQGKYSKVRLHVWVSEDNENQLNAEFFIADKRVPINGSPYRSVLSSSPIEGFTYLRVGGSPNGYPTYMKNIIASDKEITAGTQIVELPISSVNGWVANEDNSFTATEFDTEGTLVPDAINLAKLKDYSIQGSVLMGTYLRQGDNIKNLHIKTNNQEVDLPLDVGVSTSFQKDLETTDIDSLSSIIISPKG